MRLILELEVVQFALPNDVDPLSPPAIQTAHTSEHDAGVDEQLRCVQQNRR